MTCALLVFVPITPRAVAPRVLTVLSFFHLCSISKYEITIQIMAVLMITVLLVLEASALLDMDVVMHVSKFCSFYF